MPRECNDVMLGPTRIIVLSVLLVTNGSCRHSSSQNQARPSASSPAPQPSARTPSAPAELARGTVNYAFSSASGESTLTFLVGGGALKHGGSFATFRGAINVTDGSAMRASVSVDIDLGSVRTDDEKLTAALKSKRFLNIERYPQSHFRSTSVESGGALGATNTVLGSLELHGVTHAIEIPGTIHVRPDGVDVDAEFTLRRRDFDLNFAGARDGLLNDAIVVSLVVVAYPMR
jgi:polyisoprenoid-binding protein YceI